MHQVPLPSISKLGPSKERSRELACGWEGLLCLRWNKRIIAPSIESSKGPFIWSGLFNSKSSSNKQWSTLHHGHLHCDFSNMKNESEHVPI